MRSSNSRLPPLRHSGMTVDGRGTGCGRPLKATGLRCCCPGGQGALPQGRHLKRLGPGSRMQRSRRQARSGRQTLPRGRHQCRPAAGLLSLTVQIAPADLSVTSAVLQVPSGSAADLADTCTRSCGRRRRCMRPGAPVPVQRSSNTLSEEVARGITGARGTRRACRWICWSMRLSRM